MNQSAVDEMTKHNKNLILGLKRHNRWCFKLRDDRTSGVASSRTTRRAVDFSTTVVVAGVAGVERPGHPSPSLHRTSAAYAPACTTVCWPRGPFGGPPFRSPPRG